jgi:outer membrane protein assembly factor BamB
VLTVNNVGNLGLKWQFGNIGESFLSSPAVANGVVYVGSDDGNLYAINAKTGAMLWGYKTRGNDVSSSPAW